MSGTDKANHKNKSEPKDPETVEWCVAYTKPRAEKKFATYCDECGIEAILPTYESVKKYPRKTVKFDKPYFPGYVFILTQVKNLLIIKKSSYLVDILKVYDQKAFQSQLYRVLKAIESGEKLLLVQRIKPGIQVRVKRGSLRGVEGIVEKREKLCKVCIMIQILGRGVEVKVDGDDLEVLD